MNKDAEGNEYTFRTSNDWGKVTGVLLLLKDKVVYRDIGPESGDIKFTMESE